MAAMTEAVNAVQPPKDGEGLTDEKIYWLMMNLNPSPASIPGHPVKGRDASIAISKESKKVLTPILKIIQQIRSFKQSQKTHKTNSLLLISKNLKVTMLQIMG